VRPFGVAELGGVYKMIFAQALPPLWMMIASLYLLLAVPTVFIVSLLIFITIQFHRFGAYVSPCFPNSFLPFAITNAGLTFYFLYWIRQPQDTFSIMEFLWTGSIVVSILLLSLSSWQSQKAKRSTEQGAAANP